MSFWSSQMLQICKFITVCMLTFTKQTKHGKNEQIKLNQKHLRKTKMAIVDDAVFHLVFNELSGLTRFNQNSKKRNKSVTYRYKI